MQRKLAIISFWIVTACMSEEMFQRTRSSLLVRLGNLEDSSAWNAAWDSFYSQYIPMILAWCKRWNLQSDDAEEIASAVLFTLGRRMESFDYDPSHRFRGWLKTVVENEIRGYLSRRNRRPGDFGGGTDLDADSPLEQFIDPEAGAEQLASELEERRDLLHRAMDAVKSRVQPETWLAFKQTAVDDLDAATVASQLGMSIVAVYKAKSRVQELLRETVDQLRKRDY